MRSTFSAELVNGAHGDPALFVDVRPESRALLLDLGDLARLPPRKILRVSDVFVSHTHMDHFCGFDRLLRVCLGRVATVRMYGPTGFAGQVANKLAGYTWNLVDRYPGDFAIEAWEVVGDGQVRGQRLSCREQFRPEPLGARTLGDGVVADQPGLRVRAAWLDHGVACLGFAIEEKAHVNVWKNRLVELGLPTGPWLRTAKALVLEGAPDDTPVRARWRDRHGEHERVLSLGALSDVLRVVPGEKIAYVTDIGFTDENRRRVAALAAGATRLYIECAFLHEDAALAAERRHLTARQAGLLARDSGAAIVVPFHYSPRYEGRYAELAAELEAARTGG